MSTRPGLSLCAPWGAALLVALLSACRNEPPALAVESTAAPAEPVPSPAPAPPPGAGEGPWFTSGPGARALALRARGDHAAALVALQGMELPPGSADAAAAALLEADSASAESLFERSGAAYARARAHESLAPLEPALRALEAQARLDASDPAAALELLEGLEPGDGVPAEVLLSRADGLARTDALEAAVAAYKAYIEHPEAKRGPEARAKLARALGRSEDGTALREAAGIWSRLIVELPASDYAKEGREVLADGGEARLMRGPAERAEAARAEALAQLRFDLKRRRYEGVEASAAKAAKARKLPPAYACELRYLQGSAVFKQRRRADARPIFERAAKTCAKAKARDLEVKTRYQAARGRYAEGDYQRAAKDFEALATKFAEHSYADDAWILAGESWEAKGDPRAARRAYGEALRRHPDGDQAAEARRRSILLAFGESDAAALDTIEAALTRPGVDDDERAKLLYFRARARARVGATAGEVKEDLLASLKLRPLSYSGLLCLSRLHEMGPKPYEAGLALLEPAGSGAAPPSLALPGSHPEPETRAKLWSRLGFPERALSELEAAGIGGWPAAKMLAQAGDLAGAQRRIANLGSGWRSEPPSPATRAHWELAHPRAFTDIITAGERTHAVPELLTFAIMQTESRFDPNVVSWAGARGLVQLMPATARDLASRAGTELAPGDLFDPSINLDLGMRYLGSLAGRFGGGPGGAVMAAPSYNAGAGNVDKWIKARGSWDLDLFIEAIPFDETRHYAQSVMGRWFAYRWLYAEGEARVPHLPKPTPLRTGG